MADIKRVLALGFFDGVHIGHAALMNMTKKRAAQLGAAASVLSFDNHPDQIVFGKPIQLLNSTDGRTEIIRRIFGIDDVVVIHFDQSLMHMPWQEFLRTATEDMGAVHLVIGRDFSCGWKGEGTAERISAWCAEHGFGCDVIEKVKLDGIVVSSTYIKQLIADGEMERAVRYLGHPHMLVDSVRYGFRIGRKMGFPTINMCFPDGVLIPRRGVYCTKIYLEDGEYPSITNVGVRPTFGGTDDVTVETYILDFTGDLYGKKISLGFFRFLRDERRFDSSEALAGQIKQDTELTRKFFSI